MNKLFMFVLLLSLAFCPVADANDNVFKRISRTRTIRCGFTTLYPISWYNRQKNAMDGAMVEYLEASASRLNLKIQWVQEFHPAYMAQMLDSERIDMMCTPFYPSSTVSQAVNIAGIVGNMPFYVYISAMRPFTSQQLQSARIAFIDADNMRADVLRLYPKARLIPLPPKTTMKDFFEQVKYAKADALVIDEVNALNFMKTNPNVIKRSDEKMVTRKPLYVATKMFEANLAQAIKQLSDVSFAQNNMLATEIARRHGLSPGTLGLQ